jgi:hypothetical protein
LLSLRKECIFYNTGVLVEECRSFSAEVLKDFKTFVADAF